MAKKGRNVARKSKKKYLATPEIKKDPDVPKFPRGEAVRVRGSASPATIDRVGSPTTGTAASLKNFYADVDMNETIKKQLKEIAEKKMADLNAHDVDEAIKIIAGSARSMGIEVVE